MIADEEARHPAPPAAGSGPEGTSSASFASFAGVPAPKGWPKPACQAAFHGLAGDFVRMIEPESEADRHALLAQFLAAFGNCLGRSAHFRVGGDSHYTNLYVVIVGTTAKSRKGTSLGYVKEVFGRLAPAWLSKCVVSGLTSGEGLIYHVRDAAERNVTSTDGTTTPSNKPVVLDSGVEDKRLLVVESEFAQPLKAIRREGNTLSPVVREAWDGGTLQTLAKNSPTRSTGAHISIIGHITKHEASKYLDQTESTNGFGNRFLWVCAKRSKFLSSGGRIDDAALDSFAHKLGEAVKHAREAVELQRDTDAEERWRIAYPMLSRGRPGLLGAITGRAEAQTMRLAQLYALLDCSPVIRLEHLDAALAFWAYCDASARFIFGDRLGDPKADAVLRALRDSPGGMTRTEITNQVLRRHGNTSAILELLEEWGLAVRSKEAHGSGRPAERWYAKEAKEANERGVERPVNGVSADAKQRVNGKALKTNPLEPAE